MGSLATFSRTSETVSFSGLQSGVDLQLIYPDGTSLYAKDFNSANVRAYSAAGTGSKTEITGQRIALSSTYHGSYRIMFSDDTYFYFGRFASGGISFEAYEKAQEHTLRLLIFLLVIYLLNDMPLQLFVIQLCLSRWHFKEFTH